MSDPIDKLRTTLVDTVVYAAKAGVDREEIIKEMIAGTAAAVTALGIEWDLQKAIHEFELGIQDCMLQMQMLEMNPFRPIPEELPEA